MIKWPNTVVPKFRKMEQDLLERRIVPATHEWNQRAKNWFFAHGGKLSQEDGTLILTEEICLKGEQLAKNIEDVKAGRLVVDREMDELTLALGNPKHPGRVRGFGIIPWKYGFKEDRDSYRSRKRRKDLAEQSWRRNLESQVQSVEQRMHDEVNRRVALSQLGAQPDPHDQQ